MSPSELRRDIFTQLMLMHFLTGYVTGQFSEELLQAKWSIPSVFSTESGRRYWADIGQTWISDFTGSERRFGMIVDTEYRKSISRPPAPLSTSPSTSLTEKEAPGNSHHRTSTVLATSAALAVGWLVGTRWRR